MQQGSTLKERKKTYLSKQNTDALKGIFAIVIIFSHIRSRGGGTALNDSPIGMMLTAAGYLSVAVFFFIMGYGLRVSQIQKGKQYLRSFPVKRLLSFYLKYLMISGIFLIYHLVINRTFQDSFSYKQLLMLEVNIPSGWFLQASMLTYLLFYFIEKLLRLSTFPKSLILLALYLGIVPLITDSIEPFYNSYLALFAGLLFPTVKPKFDKLLEGKKSFIWTYLCIFVLFGIFLLLGHSHAIPQTARFIFKMISALLFVLFVLMTTVFVPVQNAVTVYLGARSLELYVYQWLFFSLFQSVIQVGNYLVYSALVLVCTVLISVVLHPVLALTDKLTSRISAQRGLL